jgi:hypothetical protein
LYPASHKRERRHPIHAVLLSWSSQQYIYVLKDCAAMWLAEKALRLDAKAVPKTVGEFFFCLFLIEIHTHNPNF